MGAKRGLGGRPEDLLTQRVRLEPPSVVFEAGAEIDPGMFGGGALGGPAPEGQRGRAQGRRRTGQGNAGGGGGGGGGGKGQGPSPGFTPIPGGGGGISPTTPIIKPGPIKGGGGGGGKVSGPIPGSGRR